MLTFADLKNRYTIECTVSSEADLHIGSGQEGETSDAAFIARDGNPFLPGSSLRGALRSQAERILRALFQRPVACVLFASGENELPETVCMAGNEKRRRKLESGEEVVNAKDLILCPICRLFGSTLMAGRLRVGDAVQAGTDVPRMTVVRDGVGIDRDTESARENIKFNFEVLEPGVKFRFPLIVENAEEDELALLFILLQSLKEGLEVGGKRSRGFGRVVLVDYSVSCLDKDNLETYLLTGEVGTIDTSEFHKQLQDAFHSFVVRNRS